VVCQDADEFVRTRSQFPDRALLYDDCCSEIMICDFTSHMEVVSFLNLETLRLRLNPGIPTDLPDDLNTRERPLSLIWCVSNTSPDSSVHHAFELMHSASWRETYPGDTRIILDYTGLVSFYDTALVPSLVPRRAGLERWDHRVAGISPEDIESVKDRLARALERPSVKPSGIDWKTVLRVVVDRYANRLDVMKYLLNVSLDDAPVLLHHARMVQRQLRTVLTPYTILTATPSQFPVISNGTNSWAAPVFRECATTHTSSIATHDGMTLTPSERLLLQAVRETTREICRVVTRMWASGFITGLDPFYLSDQPPEVDRIRSLMSEWNKDLMQLISWLDWSVWVKCRPACGTEVHHSQHVG